jgi:peptide/nickel transport system permease protein
MKVSSYILKRLFYLIPVLLGVSVIIFIIARTIPGDPARMMVGPKASQEVVERARQELGLDKPLYFQYFMYFRELIGGNLGISIRSHRPVLKDLMDHIPATLELTVISLLFSWLGGILLGVISAIKRNRIVDHFSRSFSLVGVSMPLFWLGLVLLLVFYRHLSWLPGPGRLHYNLSPPTRITGLYILDSLLERNWATLHSSILHILMPAFCLGYVYLAIVTRITRSSMLEVMGKEYIDTARASGLPEKRVVWKYGLKNALIPTVTIMGLSFGELMASPMQRKEAPRVENHSRTRSLLLEKDVQGKNYGFLVKRAFTNCRGYSG